MGKGKPEAVVGGFSEVDGTTHPKSKSTAEEDEGYVVQSMGVSFAQFVRPDHRCVVEHHAVAIGLRSFSEFLREKGELLAKPCVDLGQLLLRFMIKVRIMRESVMILFNSQ